MSKLSYVEHERLFYLTNQRTGIVTTLKPHEALVLANKNGINLLDVVLKKWAMVRA